MSFHDEDGFTTTGMVLALLITLSLLFSAAQVYRVNSASAEVQDIADAAALAAENQVAEFMLVVRFCDAIVLSLSLTGLAACGLGIAALCTPATAPLSKGLLEAGHKIIKTRNSFAERASKALDKLQKALPFFSAACAAGLAAANNADSSGSRYLGAALLVPAKGEPISVTPGDEAEKLLEEIDEEADDIRQKAKDAEEASQEANRSKERAFLRDCGDNPSYCMYERASHLAGLSGSSNPLFTSVDTWTFQVALDRARAYYRLRANSESPTGSSIADQKRSALRARFYRFALDELRGAYVQESQDSFEAYFPHFPGNTASMRLTSLYTESVYPITVTTVQDAGGDGADGGPQADGEEGAPTESKEVMHAWMGCPEVQKVGAWSFGSIEYMESADLETCPVCGFTASDMGKVAAASTSIDNGFEYHYKAVADEAAVYQEARHRADVPKSQVKDKVGSLFEKLSDVLKDTVGKRIEASPPGRYGAVAFVVNAGSMSAAGSLASGFVKAGGTLGPRAAVAAATLVDEGTAEGRTALNSALDGLRESGSGAVGAASIVLNAWSSLLVAYADGQSAVTGAIEHGLNALPLVGASGLGTWAADALSSAIEEVGLQPAEVGALKPVLVNSAHVAAKGEGSLSSGLLSVKQRIVAHPLMSTDLFASVLTDAEKTAVSQVEGLGDSIEIASIELLGEGGPSIPITIPLPDEAKAQGVAAIEGVFASLRLFYVEVSGVRLWE